jgi:riboflavin synthase
VSLTVNGLVADGDPEAQGFEVMLVPHTLAHTTLTELAVGRRVNLEADVLARYVARQLELGSRPGSSTRDAVADQASREKDERLLAQLRAGGFLG